MTDQTYTNLVDSLNVIYGEENPNEEHIRAFVVNYTKNVMDTVGVDRRHESRADTFLKMEGPDYVGYSVFENIEWNGSNLSIPYVELVERVVAPLPERKPSLVVDGHEVGKITDFKLTDREYTPAYELRGLIQEGSAIADFLSPTTNEPVMAPTVDDLFNAMDGFTGGNDTLLMHPELYADLVATTDVEFPPAPAPRDLRNLRYGEYVPELDPFLMERVLKTQQENRPIYTMGSPNLTAVVPGRVTHYVDDHLVDIMLWKKTRSLQEASAPGGLDAIRAARANFSERNDQAQREITNGEF